MLDQNRHLETSIESWHEQTKWCVLDAWMRDDESDDERNDACVGEMAF